ANVFGSPSDRMLLSMALSALLPLKFLEFLCEHSPGERLDRVRSFKKVNIEVAKELVQEKAKEIGEGKGNKDVMSLLVNANLSENERATMSEAELLAQVKLVVQSP
ncbi:hypothetical protein MPER_01686, partial [Moniliophthora perniciosa FA553]